MASQMVETEEPQKSQFLNDSEARARSRTTCVDNRYPLAGVPAMRHAPAAADAHPCGGEAEGGTTQYTRGLLIDPWYTGIKV